MSERSEKLEGEISSGASDLHMWKSLVEHPGWKMFAEMLKEQKQVREGEVLLKPLTSSAGIYGQEFMKGEVSGLALALISPYAQIEVLEGQLKLAREKLEVERVQEAVRAERGSGSRVDDERWHGEH